MSRYSHTKIGIDASTNISFEIEVTCGYDRPLSEYFLQAHYTAESFDNLVSMGILKEDDEYCIFAISSYSTTVPLIKGKLQYSNSEIAELMKVWKCPQEYIDKVLLDEPY